MRQRAENVDVTRRRIVEATVRLHTTVGPSNASIAAIAEEAGVTRLTVYRHFADSEQLFEACMGHYATVNPRPDPAAWVMLPDLVDRARAALGALYVWYADHGRDLLPLARDIAWWPPGAVDRNAKVQDAFVASVVGDTVDGPGGPGTLRAVIGHVAAVSTWQSLVGQQGLDTDGAVELIVSWVAAAASPARFDPRSAKGSDEERP